MEYFTLEEQMSNNDWALAKAYIIILVVINKYINTII